MNVQLAPASAQTRLPLGARVALHVFFVFSFLALWQFLIDSGRGPSFILSTPLRIAENLLEIVVTAQSWSAILATLTELFIGLLIGAPVGIALGVLFANSLALDLTLKPILVAFYTLPRLALLPLFLVIFGLGMGSKIAVVVIHGIVVFLLGSYAGASRIDARQVDACRLFGAGTVQLVGLVYLPSLLPYLVVSGRQVLGLALGSVIIAETSTSFEGIGFEISLRLARFDMSGVLAWVIIAAVLAVIFDRLGLGVYRRSSRWSNEEIKI